MIGNRRGFTLQEMTVGMAIMAVAGLAMASLLKNAMKATVTVGAAGWAQEETRQAFMKIERFLLHANEIRVASSTYVDFVVDLDQAPAYDEDGDLDGDGVPNYRDADRDADVSVLAAAADQWRIGFNLLDDDEDGDLQVDMARRLYLSSGTLWLDSRVNGAAWGSSQKLALGVSTFTLTYYGNKANNLGKAIDLGIDGNAGTADSGENDGVVAAREMDFAQAPAGMGNRNGSLDAKNERRYITSIRVKLGLDKNRDGKTDYEVETDVYPALLPLKSQ